MYGKQFGILVGEAMPVAGKFQTVTRAVLHQELGRVIIQQMLTSLGTWLLWNKDTSLDFAPLLGESACTVGSPPGCLVSSPWNSVVSMSQTLSEVRTVGLS